MECPNCHEQIPDESKFCLHCGAKTEPVLRKCDECGFDGLPADAQFCPCCCHKLNEDESGKEHIIKEMNRVCVEGGTFRMGADDGDAYDDEKPVHSVSLSDYYICEHTVTQRLWEETMGSNPSHFKGANLPVEEVSWYDCVNFCNKLSLKYGLKECYQINGTSVSLLNGGKGGFRLPTEAEWEYAACGGNKSRGFKYSGSNNLDEVAWYGSNSGSQTHAVCQKNPNELGLYDMSGNVWEWCWDWYGSYPSSSQSNPLGPSTGSYRVFRGGSWINVAGYCRVSFRIHCTPDFCYYLLGLRLVLAL